MIKGWKYEENNRMRVFCAGVYVYTAPRRYEKARDGRGGRNRGFPCDFAGRFIRGGHLPSFGKGERSHYRNDGKGIYFRGARRRNARTL